MLHQLLYATAEKFAEPVHDVRPNDRPVLVGQLGQRHAVETGPFCQLLEREAAAFAKLEVSDTLLELEP